MEKILLTPGPVEIPYNTNLAMLEKLHHRSQKFKEILAEVIENLKYVFKTKNDVLAFTSSGTGAMEASIVNLFSPGDKVLVCTNGKFSERFAEIAKAYNLKVALVSQEWGKAIEPDQVAQQLDKDTKAVFLTHSETSTGVANDVEAVGKITKERDKLFIVDTISGLCAMDFETDKWGVDVAITSSQKGLMAPPGLAFATVSAKAWEACKSNLPRYYFSFAKAKKSLEKQETPFTPTIPIVLALSKSLNRIKKEGIDRVIERHEQLAKAMREDIKAMGLELFAARPSNSVTSVLAPDNKGKEIVKEMEREGIVIANGQRHLKGKIFRIGHIGNVDEKHIVTCTDKLKVVLSRLGYEVGK